MGSVMAQIRNGSMEDAASILKNSAARLIARGEKLWDLGDLDAESLLRKNHPDDCFVYYENGIPIATMMLTFVDKLFWPDIRENESGFVHKLAVAKEYAGQDKPRKLIEYAIGLCKGRGIRFLRLDCGADRMKLRNYYESMGFRKVGQRMVGSFDAALYELEF